MCLPVKSKSHKERISIYRKALTYLGRQRIFFSGQIKPDSKIKNKKRMKASI